MVRNGFALTSGIGINKGNIYNEWWCYGGATLYLPRMTLLIHGELWGGGLLRGESLIRGESRL